MSPRCHFPSKGHQLHVLVFHSHSTVQHFFLKFTGHVTLLWAGRAWRAEPMNLTHFGRPRAGFLLLPVPLMLLVIWGSYRHHATLSTLTNLAALLGWGGFLVLFFFFPPICFSVTFQAAEPNSTSILATQANRKTKIFLSPEPVLYMASSFSALHSPFHDCPVKISARARISLCTSGEPCHRDLTTVTFTLIISHWKMFGGSLQTPEGTLEKGWPAASLHGYALMDITASWPAGCNLMSAYRAWMSIFNISSASPGWCTTGDIL